MYVVARRAASLRWSLVVLVVFAAAAAAARPATPDGDLAGLACLRVLLGMKDTEPQEWSGTVRIEPGRIVSAEGWLFEGQDKIELDGAFSLQTRRKRPITAAQRARGRQNMPVEANGFVLTLADTTTQTRVTLETNQGQAQFQLAAAQGQTQRRMDGNVAFEGLAPGLQFAGGPDNDDTPASATAADGTVYTTYSSFTPAEQWRQRAQPDSIPDSFADWSAKPGADRLWLVARRDGKWGEPVPVTDGGLDLYRPAVAVDGQGVPWVYWSQHVGCDERFMGGDWELMVRAMKPGAEGKAVQLTAEPAADVFPSAGTDGAGRVWVAWMAFRGGQSRILAARQEGQGFAAPEVVADSPRNEWEPCLTVSDDGQVGVVWDSYGKGDYDVYARIWRDGRWLDPVAVAGSPTAEMNATAAFDRGGRLWVAYETSPLPWGKDFGALEKQGICLYQGRQSEVRVVADGKVSQPKQALVDVFPGRPGPQAPQGSTGLQVSMPQVGVDGAGRVWVTGRAAVAGQRRGIGAVWYTYATCYLGDHWLPSMAVNGTDAILDSRPAVLPTSSGNALLISVCDRRQYQGQGRGAPDENLWNALLSTTEGAVEPQLDPVAEPIVAAPAEGTEDADVARMREQRYQVGNATYQVRRGEFHRHTEISSDGGGDGTLLDMWRYGLDAASFDWIGNGDHDNGGGREYYWWITQKTTTIFFDPPYFTPMFSYERSCNYPDGHRNVVFAQRGVRTLARMKGGMGKAMDDQPPEADRPHTPDTQMLYAYLRANDGICASHTSATDMGTDWRDNDPRVEPFVEIYQGDRQNYERPDAPRANSQGDSIGGWRPYGFVSYALLRGYQLAFESSSDHISTHMSYSNMICTAPTREAILDAFKNRRGYGSTDNIIADYRCTVDGVDHLMGEEFASPGPPRLRISLKGTGPIAKVVIIRNNEVVHTEAPNQQNCDFEWLDNQPVTGKTSYYYVRGEQADGELVWVSPMWIRVAG